MTAIRTLVTQAGVDTFTVNQISLPPLDGKSGYNILGITAYWDNISSQAPAADSKMDAIVQTGEDEVTFEDVEWLASASWGRVTGTNVGSNEIEPLKSRMLMEPRVTVQPEIFAAIRSDLTAQANIVTIEVVYDLIKLSELDYLRLLAGGA